MPSLETMDRHDTAVLWPCAGHDSYGEPVYDPDTRVELSPANDTGVRWVESVSTMTRADGTPVNVDATVVLGPNLDVELESLMWLGSLDEIDETGTDLLPPSNAMIVVAFTRTKDIKGRSANTRRTVGLMRYRKTMPETSE